MNVFFTFNFFFKEPALNNHHTNLLSLRKNKIVISLLTHFPGMQPHTHNQVHKFHNPLKVGEKRTG